MHLVPPQRLYQDFLAVVRGFQYFGYTLGGILLVGSLFSGNSLVLLLGSVSALLVVGAVYLSTQGLIAVVDLLSRIEVNTRGGVPPTPEPARDPIPDTPQSMGMPPLPEPVPMPDFFTDPPLPPPPPPASQPTSQPISLGLPIVFTLAGLEKKYQVRLALREEPADGPGEIAVDMSLTASDQDHLAIIRDLRDQLRQQQVKGKILIRVTDPQGQIRWENKISL